MGCSHTFLTVKSTMMKALLLVALVGLLRAEVVVKHLQVHEGATDYTRTVTLDFERNIQILEVPAHNNIVHSKTIFDFNQVRLNAFLKTDVSESFFCDGS